MDFVLHSDTWMVTVNQPGFKKNDNFQGEGQTADLQKFYFERFCASCLATGSVILCCFLSLFTAVVPSLNSRYG